jgi:hypothetical protein
LNKSDGGQRKLPAVFVFPPTPVAASVLNAGNLPTNIATRATGNGACPAGIVTFPATVECSVLAIVTLPADIECLPVAAASLPVGIDCLILTIATFPAGLKPQKQGFSMYFSTLHLLRLLGLLGRSPKTSSQPHNNYEHKTTSSHEDVHRRAWRSGQLQNHLAGRRCLCQRP